MRIDWPMMIQRYRRAYPDTLLTDAEIRDKIEGLKRGHREDER